jgi:lysophospholipase L1-like esterase
MISTLYNRKRRQILKFATLIPMGMALPNPSAANKQAPGDSLIPDSTTILFQGDSITDAGRDRAGYYANDARGMGGGYVYQIVAELQARHPGDHLKCYNRGISGNKVYQLADRWNDDCLYLQPQVLSILIGVNDYWHSLRSDYQGTPDIFNKDLRALLKRTQEKLPNIKIMLGEPFAVKGGTAITTEWETGFPPYQKMVKEISDDLGAAFVPYQQIFDEALEKGPVEHWCPDGVHPSMAGACLMKEAWLEAFNKLM